MRLETDSAGRSNYGSANRNGYCQPLGTPRQRSSPYSSVNRNPVDLDDDEEEEPSLPYGSVNRNISMPMER